MRAILKPLIMFMFTGVLAIVPHVNVLAAEQHRFQGLGADAGGWMTREARSVSADGTVVVGSIGSAVFRWTPATGAVVLGLGQGARVSDDGKVIIANIPGPYSNMPRAAQWTEQTGWVHLESLGGGFAGFERAYGISGDGSVIVGGGAQAIRWAAGSAESLGQWSTAAYSVSRDGSVVVGSGNLGQGNIAFRWTEQEGLISLGTLSGGWSNGAVVSPDGAIAAGTRSFQGIYEAFIWSESNGMVGIGSPSGGEFIPTAFTPDRSILLGGTIFHSKSPSDPARIQAFIWDADHGFRSFQHLLITNYGLGDELAGWTLQGIYDISADGRHLVGSGINAAGNPEAWMVSLGTPLPEPATVSLLAFSALILLRRQRVSRSHIDDRQG